MIFSNLIQLSPLLSYLSFIYFIFCIFVMLRLLGLTIALIVWFLVVTIMQRLMRCLIAAWMCWSERGLVFQFIVIVILILLPTTSRVTISC